MIEIKTFSFVNQFVIHLRGQINPLFFCYFFFVEFFSQNWVILFESRKLKAALTILLINEDIFGTNVAMDEILLSEVVIGINHFIQYSKKSSMLKSSVFLPHMAKQAIFSVDKKQLEIVDRGTKKIIAFVVIEVQ